MSDWNQPVCDRCWGALNGERIPHRMVEEYREDEVCARCQEPTRSGIYVRAAPGSLAQ